MIQNNYIKGAGGDAITTMYADKPLVQYNVAEDCSRQMNTTDYSATGAQRVAAGIWPWKCKDSVFQYNECYNNLNSFNGNGDGQQSGMLTGQTELFTSTITATEIPQVRSCSVVSRP